MSITEFTVRVAKRDAKGKIRAYTVVDGGGKSAPGKFLFESKRKAQKRADELNERVQLGLKPHTPSIPGRVPEAGTSLADVARSDKRTRARKVDDKIADEMQKPEFEKALDTAAKMKPKRSPREFSERRVSRVKSNDRRVTELPLNASNLLWETQRAKDTRVDELRPLVGKLVAARTASTAAAKLDDEQKRAAIIDLDAKLFDLWVEGVAISTLAKLVGMSGGTALTYRLVRFAQSRSSESTDERDIPTLDELKKARDESRGKYVATE